MSSLGKSMFISVSLLVSASAQTNILTNRYNTSRTAANLNETQLTTANVNTTTFGKLGQYSVDGVIYAQPLYVQGVTINGSSHNVLYVGTMHDVMYAFDADNIGSAPLWTLDFSNPSAGITPAPCNCQGQEVVVADTFGIFGTPVIDLPNNRMFFVTHTLENGSEYFRLREADIRTGSLLASTQITGSVPAAGSAAAETFTPAKYAQRPALEMAGGQVWVAFGSRPPGDYTAPWEGWVMTYNPNTMLQTGVFVTSRTNGNSIWQSGSGPAVDAKGNVYYLTGNGGYYDGATDFPQSLLKMNFGSSLALSDWYTPDGSNDDNYVFLDNYDLDLSCNGPMLIPGTDLIAFGSKTADVFVLHTSVSLGHLTPNDTQLAQFFHVGAVLSPIASDSDRLVGMAYWQRTNGGTLYAWPGQDALHAFTLNPTNSIFNETFAGSTILPGQPATALALSANGSNSGSGIVWAPVMQTTVENNVVGQPGILHAYNAENPSQELWNSNMSSADGMGSLAKFVPPVVVNGKVYMANSANDVNYSAGSITVFGLKNLGTPVGVSLSSGYDVYGIFNNGTAPTHGGLDSHGYAYSGNLLGSSIIWSEVTFEIGAPGVADAVSGGTISLPSGSYATLKLLATGVNGAQPNQSFVVAYTDGTTTTFVQSLSDWSAPSNYTGESVALTESYRVTPSGATQNGAWHVYGYSFALNSSKVVKNITLPSSRNVVILGMALSSAGPQPGVISISPQWGSGLTQTFTATYSDANGATGVNAAYLLFNTTLSAASGCYVQYYPPDGLIFLVNDAGTTMPGRATWLPLTERRWAPPPRSRTASARYRLPVLLTPWQATLPL